METKPDPHLRLRQLCLYRILVVSVALLLASRLSGPPNSRRAQADSCFRLHMPVIFQPTVCQPIPEQDYIILSADPPGPHIPADVHPDLNLMVRGYEPTEAYKGLVEYGGSPDPKAPQLAGLFAEPHLPLFLSAYQVYSWDWQQMQRGPSITDPPVTALGLATTPGETLHVPDSGYTIGSGCEVLVLYATTDRITLKYTREDNVVYGYTLHVDYMCVDPSLIALYEACNNAGRGYLPALRPGQPFGRARDRQVVVAIVDSGTFLDARSHKDWWKEY